MANVHFITHPDVLIDPAVPVPQWGLSPRGHQRIRALLTQSWIATLGAVWCSTERKAIEGAEIIAAAIGTCPRPLETLGENDRSATGYLPKSEFESTADAFFAHPSDSIRGWETAIHAQRRIIAAIATVAAETPPGANASIVSHGGVGTLLLCHLKRRPISRTEEQPGAAGGNHFCFDRDTGALKHGWQPVDR